jgi:hypothetical protein
MTPDAQTSFTQHLYIYVQRVSADGLINHMHYEREKGVGGGFRGYIRKDVGDLASEALFSLQVQGVRGIWYSVIDQAGNLTFLIDKSRCNNA